MFSKRYHKRYLYIVNGVFREYSHNAEWKMECSLNICVLPHTQEIFENI